MFVYYLNLFLILALGLPLCLYKPNNIKKAIYLIVVFGYMWFLATYRYGIGFDYNSYINIFLKIRETASFSEAFALGYEPGFTLLTKLMALFVNGSVAMYGIYEALILLPVMWFIFRYCRDAWLSTWLFVTLTFFYTSMNFVRQSLACGIVLLGYRFLRDKKLVPFLLIVLAAATFHKTALVMIPVYFLCHIKLSKKMAIFYASATLILYLSSGYIIDFVTNYIFTSYKGSIYIDPKYGFSLVFLIIPLLVFGACLALWPTWKKRCESADMFLNLMMFNVIFWLFITKHFVIERFSMYIYIFVLIALPWAISCLRASPEDYAKRDAMVLEAESEKGGKGGKGKNWQAQLKTLTQDIKDREKYYWSAVVAVLIITIIYHDFGANVNGFHKVFPYQSILEWPWLTM